MITSDLHPLEPKSPYFWSNPLLFKAKSPYLGGWKYGMYVLNHIMILR
jgi:hypothetical protein